MSDGTPGPEASSEPAAAPGRNEGRREDGITILIRGRNRRTLLPHALRSAFDALEFLDVAGVASEIVVVDDSSRDGSQKLLRGVQSLYGEERLRIWCLGERSGRLLSTDLRVSSYRLVCVMNARNELLPANLPLFVRSASETGAAMVYGNVLDKWGGTVAGVRSSMPVVPGLPKSRNVDGFCVVDAERLPDADGTASGAGERGAEGWELALRLQEGGEDVVFVPAVLGYHHGLAYEESGDVGIPSWRAPPRADAGERDVRRLARIYHPEVGFVDE